MGNSNARSSSPVPKCPKFEPTEFDVNLNKTIEERCDIPSVPTNKQGWDRLPYVALVEVYKHLSNNDKAYMSRTCKSWLIPFSRPVLWRQGNFRFNGIDDWKAMRFVFLMGSALRHIIVDCSMLEEENYLSLNTKSSCENFRMFLNTLFQSQNKKLKTFIIHNMARFVRGSLANDVQNNPLHLVISLIEAQEGIRVLDLTNAGLMTHQAIYILENVKQQCGVHVLSIVDVVAQIDRFELATEDRFIQLFTSFTNLTGLSLSEEYVTIDLLETLSNTVLASLQYMEVMALYNMRRRPVNNEGLKDSWKSFCEKIPHLYLTFIVKGIFVNRNMIKILPSALNLSQLVLDTGCCLMDFRLFYLHMAKFKFTLVEVDLSIYIGTESDATYIVKLVEKLQVLRRFNLDSPLMPMHVQFTLERDMRQFMNSKRPEERESIDIIINERELNLKESWYTYFVGWLSHVAVSSHPNFYQ